MDEPPNALWRRSSSYSADNGRLGRHSDTNSMRQILQDLRSGATTLADVPCPQVGKGHLLIRTTRSLISAGTERMVMEFGKASMLSKARQQPERLQLALEKARTDGILPTIEAIRNKLDQ